MYLRRHDRDWKVFGKFLAKLKIFGAPCADTVRRSEKKLSREPGLADARRILAEAAE